MGPSFYLMRRAGSPLGSLPAALWDPCKYTFIKEKCLGPNFFLGGQHFWVEMFLTNIFFQPIFFLIFFSFNQNLFSTKIFLSKNNKSVFAGGPTGSQPSAGARKKGP